MIAAIGHKPGHAKYFVSKGTFGKNQSYDHDDGIKYLGFWFAEIFLLKVQVSSTLKALDR